MDLTKYKNVTIIDHPLLTHKISLLRNVGTRTNDFRLLVKEIAILEGYEALKHVSTINKEIDTPIEKTTVKMVDASKLCFVPILRAGLGMADGMLELVPGAVCGHIGLYRDKETHNPVEYYCKLPKDIADKDVYLLDPMLATGGSALDAIELLKGKGVKNIKFLCRRH